MGKYTILIITSLLLIGIGSLTALSIIYDPNTGEIKTAIQIGKDREVKERPEPEVLDWERIARQQTYYEQEATERTGPEIQWTPKLPEEDSERPVKPYVIHEDGSIEVWDPATRSFRPVK